MGRNINYKEVAERIQKEVGSMALVIPLVNGVQAHIGNTETDRTTSTYLIINFYYKKKKAWFPLQNKGERFIPGQEGSFIINKYAALKVKTKAIVALELNDKGTQACIDHVKRKLEAYSRVNPERVGDEVTTILTAIINELPQYL
jgi:hypothetical protein